MLLKLPLDLLIQIALCLPTNDKLQLVLTCKRLKDAIHERCLFETVDLLWEDGEETESIVLKFQKYRSKAQQVKVLKLHSVYLSNQLFSEMPLIFPNVVEYVDNSYDQRSRPGETYNEFIKWKDTIERLRHGGGEEISPAVKTLAHNVFSRLTTLELNQLENDGEVGLGYFDFIKNAPALECLSLEDFVIDLRVIEVIHSNFPRLVSFNLNSCSVLISEDESVPKEIVPASRLSSFTLVNTSIYDQRCVFLNYITRKYTNLVKFEFNPGFSEERLYLLFPNQDVEELTSNPDYIARRDELQATDKSYTTSASAILSNLPSTLKSLMMLSPDIHNAMIIFSKKCVNITHLYFTSLFSACGDIFASPGDISVLGNLPFLKHLSILIDPSVQIWKRAPASTSVTKLKVDVKGISTENDMDIGWLLVMFPSLNNLEIERCGARLIGYETDPPRTYPKLTKLTIGPNQTHANLLNYIKDVAPNLKDLHWGLYHKQDDKPLEFECFNHDIVIHPNKPTLQNERRNYTIDLGGFSLNCFDLEIRQDENKDDIILKFENKYNSKTMCFILKESEYAYFNGATEESITKDIKKMVTILYDYTKFITVNDFISIDLEKSNIQLNFY